MTRNGEKLESVDRRRVLRGVAGATTGLATLGAMSSPAAAGDKGDDCDPDGDVPRIDTSDHYDTTWYGSVYLTDGNSEDNYDTENGDLPDEPDELLVHVHGWNNNEKCGADGIESVADAYDDADYDHEVTGLTWDSDYSWWDAKEIAEKNAPKLANFLTDYAEDNPDTVIRLQAHSLGARLVAETLLELDEDDEDDIVTTVVFLAGAIDNESVAVDGTYGEAIENVTHHTENFWMEDDDVLEWAYETIEFSSAIGNEGVDGEAPDNYTDTEIEKDLGHSDVYDDGDVVEQVIDTFETPDDDSDD